MNIHRQYWKERLKISKLAQNECDMPEASKDRALQSREILQTFVWLGGTNLAHTIEASVKSRNIRSSSVSLRNIPRVNSAFSYSAPTLWNSLPNVPNPVSSSSFNFLSRHFYLGRFNFNNDVINVSHFLLRFIAL